MKARPEDCIAVIKHCSSTNRQARTCVPEDRLPQRKFLSENDLLLVTQSIDLISTNRITSLNIELIIIIIIIIIASRDDDDEG